MGISFLFPTPARGISHLHRSGMNEDECGNLPHKPWRHIAGFNFPTDYFGHLPEAGFGDLVETIHRKGRRDHAYVLAWNHSLVWPI